MTTAVVLLISGALTALFVGPWAVEQFRVANELSKRSREAEARAAKHLTAARQRQTL